MGRFDSKTGRAAGKRGGAQTAERHDMAALGRRGGKSTQEKHRQTIASIEQSTRRLREHNDEVETKERLRKRGSIPPAKGDAT